MYGDFKQLSRDSFVLIDFSSATHVRPLRAVSAASGMFIATVFAYIGFPFREPRDSGPPFSMAKMRSMKYLSVSGFPNIQSLQQGDTQ
jgi:hypothetical protein